MANATKIEWTDFNWNFLRGCSRVSEGCRNCYAEGVAARFSGYNPDGKKLPYFGLAQMVNGKPRWTGEISYHEDILLQPLRWTKPRKIFVNSMSDLFHEKVTDGMLDKAFAVMALTPQHIFQILTKRPERMKSYLSKSDRHVFVHEAAKAVVGYHSPIRRAINREDLPLLNVWLGVSVEDQKTANERIPLLLDTPAAIRWMSAEPLLGPIDLEHIKFPNAQGNEEDWNVIERIVMPNGVDDPTLIGEDDPILDWVVVGGESGPNSRSCDIGNIRSIVTQCEAADVPVFVKQLGRRPIDWRSGCPDAPPYEFDFFDRKGGDPSEWPEDLRVREFPNAETRAASV